MIWTVVLSPPASEVLAILAKDATDPRKVWNSVEYIRRELRLDADKKGQPWGPYRIFSDGTLSVLFDVDAGGCVVKVITVRLDN
jgi:hypothetical protein